MLILLSEHRNAQGRKRKSSMLHVRARVDAWRCTLHDELRIPGCTRLLARSRRGAMRKRKVSILTWWLTLRVQELGRGGEGGVGGRLGHLADHAPYVAPTTTL